MCVPLTDKPMSKQPDKTTAAEPPESEKLLTVKQSVDPHHYFTFPQAIGR